jgi:hypothetical protein
LAARLSGEVLDPDNVRELQRQMARDYCDHKFASLQNFYEEVAQFQSKEAAIIRCLKIVNANTQFESARPKRTKSLRNSRQPLRNEAYEKAYMTI